MYWIKYNPTSRFDPSGFTLIEPLVMISIVILLSAILIPSLKKAKKPIQTIFRRSNLKQWSMVIVFSMSKTF